MVYAVFGIGLLVLSLGCAQACLLDFMEKVGYYLYNLILQNIFTQLFALKKTLFRYFAPEPITVL